MTTRTIQLPDSQQGKIRNSRMSMLHLLIGVMVFTLGAGCTERGTKPAESPTTASEESEPPDFRTPEEPKPPAMVKLAEIAGQGFRRANPDKLKETFESFGYVATEAEGTWTTGFEHSGFKPHGERSTEEWWLSGFADTVSDLPKGQKIPDEGVGIRITGFLSPRGSYGHLGSYDHQFYATKISKSNGD